MPYINEVIDSLWLISLDDSTLLHDPLHKNNQNLALLQLLLKTWQRDIFYDHHSPMIVIINHINLNYQDTKITYLNNFRVTIRSFGVIDVLGFITFSSSIDYYFFV